MQLLAFPVEFGFYGYALQLLHVFRVASATILRVRVLLTNGQHWKSLATELTERRTSVKVRGKTDQYL